MIINVQKFFLNIIVISSLILVFCCTGSKKLMKMDNIMVDDVYEKGKRYIFNYEFFDSAGYSNKFRFNSPFYQTNVINGQNVMEAWDLVENNNPSELNLVDKLYLDVIGGAINDGQTAIIIKYISAKGNKITEEATGIIQTIERNWVHPPRVKSFAILELAPFPEIRNPIVVGNSWKSSLLVGDLWSSEKWFKWSGNIKLDVSYEIIKKSEIELFGKKVFCYKVSAQNFMDKKLISSSEFYFTKEYGFVTMEFKNINESKLKLELTRIVNIL